MSKIYDLIFGAEPPAAEQWMKGGKMKKINKIIVVGIAIAAIFSIAAAIGAKRANDLEAYALTNNCEWVWSGTMYGDNRDFVCK